MIPSRNNGTEAEVEVLLLDFGGVCLLNPVELHPKAERLLGLEPESLDWIGPLDPRTDPLWVRMIKGELTEREYWHKRTVEIGRAAGRDLVVRDYMDLIYNPPSDALIRPGASRVVAAAQAAGYGVSVLTNDLRAFHGREWEHGIGFLGMVDHVIDCSDTNILKPDPRAFERALHIVGSVPERVLFVDDQPLNVQGGSDCGLQSMWFDISDADKSWDAVAQRLGVGAVDGR